MTTPSIDYEQPESIDEHFKLIMQNKTSINPTYSKVTPENLPAWFNEDLFKVGQNFYKNNRLTVTAGAFSGLMAVFLIPSISNVLNFTEKSSTPCSAFKRYVETVLHTINLYEHDPRDSKSKFYKTINTIRWYHSTSSKRYSKKIGNEGILKKDMVLTQFGFMGYILACPDKLGVSENFEEKEGFTHFWRVVAHLLDIPDRLNLCRKNQYETALICKKILDEVYGKHLDSPSKNFNFLTKTCVDGLNCLDPTLDLDTFLVLFYALHNKTYERQISWYSKANVSYRRLNFYLLRTPYVGFVVRHYWNFYLKSIIWFTEKFPIIAWLKFGKENSKINLYPPLA